MLHELRPALARTDEKRIGRGGKRGKTSGRGVKGQWAHGGHGVRPDIRDMIKKIPKLRGRGISMNKSIQTNLLRIDVARIDAAFPAGAEVNPITMVEMGLLRAHPAMRCDVKVLGNGAVTKKFIVTGCDLSAGAKAKILAAGGSAE